MLRISAKSSSVRIRFLRVERGGGHDDILAFLGGREDDVAGFAILSVPGSAFRELFHAYRLAIGIAVALRLRFTFTMGDQARQVFWGLGGKEG